ncbi:MAG: flavin reductase [Clostridia bacterium]|nr:flavin reductase [Clostridia bacterium]
MGLDIKALFNLGYGLYVVSSNDGNKDNGAIVNTVMQLTDSPARVAVCINKNNYTHDTVKNSGIMNINVLTESAPFSLFQNFGFKSGKTEDKFAGIESFRSENGLLVLTDYINSFISLKVEQYIDVSTHGMFICTVEDARTMYDTPTMTYSYYHKNVKPKPDDKPKKGYICKMCGYVYEGEPLPDDFVCPLCKHGASDFEKL